MVEVVRHGQIKQSIQTYTCMHTYIHTHITMDDLLHTYSEKYQNTANEKFIKECRCLLFTLFILDFTFSAAVQLIGKCISSQCHWVGFSP